MQHAVPHYLRSDIAYMSSKIAWYILAIASGEPFAVQDFKEFKVTQLTYVEDHQKVLD